MSHLRSLLLLLTPFLLVSCGNQELRAPTNTTSTQIPVVSNQNASTQGNTNVVSSIENKNANSTASVKSTQKAAPVSSATKTFKGTWFSIAYPQQFTVRTSQPTEEKNDASVLAEAYFTSPDKQVEFYIYSPQWSGASSYMKVKPTERVADEKTETTGVGLEKTQTTWKTFQAKDGGYLRSAVEIRGQLDTDSEVLHVFGYQYKDQQAYERYRDAYLAFKKSLQQFAD